MYKIRQRTRFSLKAGVYRPLRLTNFSESLVHGSLSESTACECLRSDPDLLNLSHGVDRQPRCFSCHVVLKGKVLKGQREGEEFLFWDEMVVDRSWQLQGWRASRGFVDEQNFPEALRAELETANKGLFTHSLGLLNSMKSTVFSLYEFVPIYHFRLSTAPIKSCSSNQWASAENTVESGKGRVMKSGGK